MRLITYTPALRNRNAAAFAANPFALLEAEMQRLFGNTSCSDLAGVSSSIPVEFNEDAEAYQMRAELPGVTKDDITIEVLEGRLALRATRRWKSADGEQRRELEHTVSLGDDVDVSGITATHENGLLSIRLPKKEQPKPVRISVS